MVCPERLAELDVQHIPIALCADKEKIKALNVGIGDEVFIAGLFTKITEMRPLIISRDGYLLDSSPVRLKLE
jgi:hypothetical protein